MCHVKSAVSMRHHRSCICLTLQGKNLPTKTSTAMKAATVTHSKLWTVTSVQGGHCLFTLPVLQKAANDQTVPGFPSLSLSGSKIVKCLSDGCNTLEIAKLLRRNHRTIKRFVAYSWQGCKKHMEKKRRKVTVKNLSRIKCEDTRNSLFTSATIFQ